MKPYYLLPILILSFLLFGFSLNTLIFLELLMITIIQRVGLNLGGMFYIPLELTTLLIIITSRNLGILPGILLTIISITLSDFFTNQLSFTPWNVLAFSLVSLLAPFFPSLPLALIFLTIFYDLLTNFIFSCLYGTSFLGGMPYIIGHIISNTFIAIYISISIQSFFFAA